MKFWSLTVKGGLREDVSSALELLQLGVLRTSQEPVPLRHKVYWGQKGWPYRRQCFINGFMINVASEEFLMLVNEVVTEPTLWTDVVR